MELKAYQQRVIQDLKHYLEILAEMRSYPGAFRQFWQEKGTPLLGCYRDTIPGVPNLCFKIPTGGGKTFVACNTIRPIFDALPPTKAKAVVWLVPSDAILTQTEKALKDRSHPYRRCIDLAFGGRVEVYSKQELLNGQNFNPVSVTEQLSVMVLSYDSFRGRGKEVLKAYQENSNLALFPRVFGKPAAPIPQADETALFQVINQLFPLVIVDESHHARTPLSLDMLKNFNPCFVLDLTATPRVESNIISYVDAVQLKKEHMVKLPVIVHNCPSQKDVLLGAISLRRRLEKIATEAERTGGSYIRPIALLQAEPRGKEDRATFDKLKTNLLEMGIPESHIAIRTAEVNELKKVSLLSRECPIRYIITINALKEGWDCPFAYVLASLANKTSKVDVEQILGRILRLPYAKDNSERTLNMSYILTSSSDFGATVEEIVKGLNYAGFSKKDYRLTAPELLADAPTETTPQPVQGELPLAQPETPTAHPTGEGGYPLDDEWDIGTSLGDELVRDAEQEDATGESILQQAQVQGQAFEEEMQRSQDDPVADTQAREVMEKMNSYQVKAHWKDEIRELRLPCFFASVEASLFSDADTMLLTEEQLAADFSLRDKAYQIDTVSLESEIRRIDVAESEDGTPKVYMLNEASRRYMRDLYDSLPQEARIRNSKKIILDSLNKLNTVDTSELRDYVDRIVRDMSNEQLGMMERNPMLFGSKIKANVQQHLDQHCRTNFFKWLETGKITCVPSYRLPDLIHPTTVNTNYPGSLYDGEEDMNNLERDMVLGLTSLLDNTVSWWHRNIARSGFCINGFIRHYPDLIVKTVSGKIVLLETKGDYLKNEDTQAKLELGKAWAKAAGKQYRYYMVFPDNSSSLPQGAYTLTDFLHSIMREL